MIFTSTQKATLKAFIQNDATLGPKATAGDYDFVANALNANASPDFWVWRTNVSRQEIYNLTSVDATTWDWSKYKAQNVTEQNAWTQMFMGDVADFSQANLRAGISNIFTAGSAVNATHAFAIGRRKATLLEKVLATGTGSSGSPAVMGADGSIGAIEIGGVLA